MFARQHAPHRCYAAAQSCRTQLAWWAQDPLPPLVKEARPPSPPASPEKARTSVSRVDSSTMGDRQSPLGSEPAVWEAGCGPQIRQIQTQPEQRAASHSRRHSVHARTASLVHTLCSHHAPPAAP